MCKIVLLVRHGNTNLLLSLGKAYNYSSFSPLPCYVIKLYFFLPTFLCFIEIDQRIHLCTRERSPSQSGYIFLCERYPEAHLTPSSMVKQQHIYNSVREADGQTTEDSDTETEQNGTERNASEDDRKQTLRRAEQIRH